MRNDAAPIFFSSSQPRGGGASAVASVATSIPLTHGIRVGTRPPRPRTSATPSTPPMCHVIWVHRRLLADIVSRDVRGSPTAASERNGKSLAAAVQ